MFQFSEWQKGQLQRVYISSQCQEPVWVERLVKSGFARVRCKMPAEVGKQTALISSAGFNFDQSYTSWEALVEELLSLPGNHARHGQSAKNIIQTHQKVNSYTSPISSVIDIRSAESISDQTYTFSIDSAPFKAKTINDCIIFVDPREPDSVFDKLSEGRIAVERQTLEVGDIMLVSADTKNHLIIERKTITDFYGAIVGDQHRAHSQAERLSLYQQRYAEQGIKVQVVWIIEGELNGKRTLYNTLPKSNQMDGMVNYLVAILGQHVVLAYNTHHLCYLASKFVQGFFEQELYYPVRTSTGSQVDLKRSERQAHIINTKDENNHGVSIPGRENLFHVLTAFKSINSRIANSLIESGLVLQDIIALSEIELARFDGVGKVTATKIYNDFRM